MVGRNQINYQIMGIGTIVLQTIFALREKRVLGTRHGYITGTLHLGLKESSFINFYDDQRMKDD